MSIISHDMKTPLMNVQSYLEVLNTSALDPTDRLVLEKVLLKSTNNTMEMLSNLLHWYKSQMEGPNINLVDNEPQPLQLPIVPNPRNDYLNWGKKGHDHH